MNRSARRLPLFEERQDYRAFLAVLTEAGQQRPMRLLDYCVMPNHWHLVLWPEHDGDLSRYLAWLTTTHALRWRAERATLGEGAVYQGRFRGIPVQTDSHFLAVCRYVERNPVRAGLVRRAEDWPWSSCSTREEKAGRPELAAWPVARPSNWLDLVNTIEPASSLAELRRCIDQRHPFGTADWQAQTMRRLGYHWPPREPGRPAAHPIPAPSNSASLAWD